MPKPRKSGIIESTSWRRFSECHKAREKVARNVVALEQQARHFLLTNTFPFYSLAPAMYFSDYAYNKGLKHTTVASSTVLVSTSCVFVLFLSVLLGVEPFRCGKLLGVLFAVTGTAMTTWHDAVKQDDMDEMQQLENEDVDMVYGDMWSLLAAVGYAVYSVQALMLCPKNEDLYSMTLLMGYVGIICSVPLLPMALYKMLTLEGLTLKSMGILIVKGLLDFVVTDYLLFRAIILTSATVANVGLGLTIPLAFAADAIFKDITLTSLQAMGALTVLAGFILVNWMSSFDESLAAAGGAVELANASMQKDDVHDEPPELPYNEGVTHKNRVVV